MVSFSTLFPVSLSDVRGTLGTYVQCVCMFVCTYGACTMYVCTVCTYVCMYGVLYTIALQSPSLVVVL